MQCKFHVLFPLLHLMLQPFSENVYDSYVPTVRGFVENGNIHGYAKHYNVEFSNIDNIVCPLNTNQN